jgi:hypothetical protein
MSPIRITAVILLGIVAAPFASAFEQDAIEARMAQMRAFDPPWGTWQGRIDVTSAPDELAARTDDGELVYDSYRIRVELAEGAAPVIDLWYSGDKSWSRIDGDSVMAQNHMGWTVTVQRSGGVWIEKYHITFDHMENDEAAITFTRTVHNWLGAEPGTEIPPFYHVFGPGMVERVAPDPSK